LGDALLAGTYARRFIEGRSLDEYRQDRMLSSAVERQMEILGEALNRVLKADPDLADTLTDVRAVIGFRNILAHDYERVSHLLVWSILTESLPELLITLERLIEDLDDLDALDTRANDAVIPWAVAKREFGL
jgi:uncharacterized protein with HEPN domain